MKDIYPEMIRCARLSVQSVADRIDKYREHNFEVWVLWFIRFSDQTL